MKALSCMALGLTVLGGCVQARKAPEAGQVLSYTDWGSFNTVLKSGKVVFGAGSDTRPEGKGVYTIYTDMFAESCAPRFLTITFELDSSAAKSVKSQPAEGELRVDDLPPFKTACSYELRQGQTKVFIDFVESLNDKTFVDQLINGHFLRVKAVVEGKELSFKFTLKNHVNAVNRAIGQCKEEAAFKSGGGAPAPAARPAPSGSGPLPGASPGKSEDSKYF